MKDEAQKHRLFNPSVSTLFASRELNYAADYSLDLKGLEQALERITEEWEVGMRRLTPDIPKPNRHEFATEIRVNVVVPYQTIFDDSTKHTMKFFAIRMFDRRFDPAKIVLFDRKFLENPDKDVSNQTILIPAPFASNYAD